MKIKQGTKYVHGQWVKIVDPRIIWITGPYVRIDRDLDFPQVYDEATLRIALGMLGPDVVYDRIYYFYNCIVPNTGEWGIVFTPMADCAIAPLTEEEELIRTLTMDL